MHNFEIIVIISVTLIVLMARTNKLKIFSPILLVVMSLTLGFVPAPPSFVLNRAICHQTPRTGVRSCRLIC
jgi:hypothetical protein